MKFEALKRRSVAVIGCGGLGNNVLAHLAGAGVGTVYFCDFDRVDASNLDRQFLFSHADAGRRKTECVSAFFSRYAPGAHAVPFDKKIESADDLSFAANCDLLCVAADNNAARAAAQAFCLARGIPLLSGGVDGFFGVAYLFVPGASPCLSCAGLLDRETKEVVSVSSTVGVVGALCADIAVRRLLREDPADAGVLHVFDHAQIQKLKIKASPACGVCNQRS